MVPTTFSNDAHRRKVVTIHLQKIPLLAGIEEMALREITPSFQVKTFARGGPVLQKGSAGEHLLFLLSGRLQTIDLTEDGQEVGLNFLNEGDYFGELSIIDGLPRSASVVATEISLVAFLPRAQAMELITKNPMIAERMLKKMAASVRSATSYRTILGIPNAFQRVFALLNQIAKTAPGGLVLVEKMPTQQEIAITANTSRETVSRAINILIQKGIVEKDLRRLIIRLPENLRKAMTSDLASEKSR